MLGMLRLSPYCSITDRMFPAGSVNQAIFGPRSSRLIPRSSVFTGPSFYTLNVTPLSVSAVTVSSILGTVKFSTVNSAGTCAGRG